jgi:hypothetical protein
MNTNPKEIPVCDGETSFNISILIFAEQDLKNYKWSHIRLNGPTKTMVILKYIFQQ